MTLTDALRSYPDQIKEKLPVSIGASMTFLPIGAFLETMVYGMDNIESLKARFAVALVTTAALPAALSMRDASRRRFNCADKSIKQGVHDLALYIPASSVFTAAIYQGLPTLTGLTALGFGALTAGLGAVAEIGKLASGNQFKKALASKDSPQRTFARRWAVGVASASLIATTAIYAGNQTVDDTSTFSASESVFQTPNIDSLYVSQREEKYVGDKGSVRY